MVDFPNGFYVSLLAKSHMRRYAGTGNRHPGAGNRGPRFWLEHQAEAKLIVVPYYAMHGQAFASRAAVHGIVTSAASRLGAYCLLSIARMRAT